MRIIGLNGRLHSGKDTAFTVIEREARKHGLVAKRAGFADKLKLSGVISLGFKPESVEEAVAIANEIKESGTVITRLSTDQEGGYVDRSRISGRAYWQIQGTEAHRDVFGEDFWVDALLPTTLIEAEQQFPGVNVLVVTDVRFPNEAQRIRSLFGEVWWINADKRLGPLPPGAHSSEHPLSNELLTRAVENNGTLEEFKDVLIEAYNSEGWLF